MTIFKIQHPLLDNNKITYGFFSRLGGVSKEPFESLNCSFKNEDDKKNVTENINLIRKELNLKTIVKLNQIHSPDIIEINNKQRYQDFYNADGIVTNLTNIGLSILSADCAPILLYDDISNTIGACHAGWRGAINNIVESIIIKMENIGAKRDDIVAVIGPTIQKESYVIREDVAGIVKKSIFFEKNKSILCYKNHDKYLFDLPLLLKENFKFLNIKKVGDVKLDTYNSKNLFFSHRRTFHENLNKKSVTGRQLSVIGILS